jgi:hypothetical protein
MIRPRGVPLGLVILALAASLARTAPPVAMERVRVSDDRRGFLLDESKQPFVAWGFNYDHDESGRLLEDYWVAEWPKVVEDFHEMAAMKANVVRIHLQVGKFLRGPDDPDREALDRLERLLKLAEECHLYLDLTGLGCYHQKDVPAWYDALSEEGRWAAQARFWEAIATRCANSPAVFCYDLMNEPVVPGGKRSPGDWLGPAFAGKHFVQMITLDQGGRPRPEIARRWVETLAAAVRKHDRRHLITLGFVDWSLDRPGLTSGFVPEKVAGALDFLAVHLYPEAKQESKAIETLRAFAAVGKPVVIEETFPLKCSPAEFRRFLDNTQPLASGWIGFYWGKTREECRRSNAIADALIGSWLDLFIEQAPRFARPNR